MSEHDKQEQESVTPTPASAAAATTAVDEAGNPLPAGQEVGPDLAAQLHVALEGPEGKDSRSIARNAPWSEPVWALAENL